MAGIAMITIEASIVAIVMLSVVLDSAIQRYRSGFRLADALLTDALLTDALLTDALLTDDGAGTPDARFTLPESAPSRTLTQSTANHLLDSNY
jgi:hypothetical protein